MKERITKLGFAAFLLSAGEGIADDGPGANWGVAGSYYHDSDSNGRHDEALWGKLPVRGFTVAAEAVSHAAHDSSGDPSSQEVLVGLDVALPGIADLEVRAGALRFDGDVDPAGRLKARRVGSWGEVSAVLQYSALAETAAMIRNHVTWGGLQLDGKAALHERFRPDLRVAMRDYSDDNMSLRLRSNLPVAVLLSPLRWEVGYRQEYATFERQSGSGYFDPSSLHSFQAVTSVSYGSGRFEGYGEFYGGLQKSRRYGNDNSEGFYGLYAEAAVNNVGPFRLAITLQGGDYALGTAGGFRHVQAGLAISNGTSPQGIAAE